MTDVAIVGIGIHPFGRTAGLSGRHQGVFATRQALADASCSWSDIQFAYGGSQDAGNADAMVNELGLTGLQFTNVSNGCATGGSALSAAYFAVKSGAYDLGIVVGFDKHEPGAFRINPADWGLGNWYGEMGLALTTQFFAMKIQRYMANYGITEDSLIRVAEKAYQNGSLNPVAWRREALSYERIATSPMVSDPLRKLMFCSPGEGGVALVVCNAAIASRHCRRPARVVRGVLAKPIHRRRGGSDTHCRPCGV
jgi:acetyl-CoA acetyltransferase